MRVQHTPSLRRRTRRSTIVGLALGVAVLGGCKSDSTSDKSGEADNPAATLGAAEQNIVVVDPQAAQQTIEADSPVVLDIRTPAEYQQGHLEGADNIDYYESNFADRLSTLDKNAEYVMYCQSGNRSAQAAKIMRELGFTNVEEIGGGIQAWQADGLPVVRN